MNFQFFGVSSPLVRICVAGIALHVTGALAVEAQTLPATYDLRNVNGKSLVPAIQDQSNVGDCWAFATTTALDSNLIVNGYLPTRAIAPPMALSQWYLTVYNGAAQYTGSTNDGDYSDYNGLTGGFCWMTTSYCTRGQGQWRIPDANPTSPPDQYNNITLMSGGPVLAANNVLNPFPLTAAQTGKDLVFSVPPANQKVNYTLTGAYYFDQWNSGRTAAEQIIAVKQAIMTYGGLATYMYAGGYTNHHHDVSVFHFDKKHQYEYELDPGKKTSDHVVTIIGWDDKRTLPGQTTPGAWIVQNSWGAWGGTLAVDDGTFYAPYTDRYIGIQGVTALTAVPNGRYGTAILENETGPTDSTGNRNGNGGNGVTGMGTIGPAVATVAVSKLTSVSTQTLLAIGLTSINAEPGATKSVEVSFYNGFDATTGKFGTPYGPPQTFTFPQKGYTLFKLAKAITFVGGTVLAVKVDYEGSPIPYVWASTADDGANPASGLTYFRTLKGAKTWQDFATFAGTTNDSYYRGVFPVKGIVSSFAP